MSQSTDPLAPDPMAPVDAMELAAWRIAQTARQLRREQPDVPVRGFRPVGVFTGRPELEIEAGSLGAAQEWAQRLGVEATSEIHVFAPDAISEHVTAETNVGDVHVEVYGTRFFDPAECEAYHREQAADRPVPYVLTDKTAGGDA